MLPWRIKRRKLIPVYWPGDVLEVQVHLSVGSCLLGCLIEFHPKSGSNHPSTKPCEVITNLMRKGSNYSGILRSNWALSATMMVLKDIRSAPTAGESTMPQFANTPAANGMATMLYPAAHHRFWIILR